LQRATSTTSGSGCYDAIDIFGGLSLGGSLNVVLTNSFMPALGDTFEILRYGQLSGDFGSVSLPVFDNGLAWQRVTTGSAMSLVVTRSAVTIDVPTGLETLASTGYASLQYATSLGKTGTGTLLLDGEALLTGSTSIQQGTLAISSNASISASPLIDLAAGSELDVTQLAGGYTVSSGQTLAGSGIILGSVTFGQGSTLSPGSFSTPPSVGIQGTGPSVGVTEILTVPEPGTLGLVGIGLGGIGLRFLGVKARRRKRAV